MNIELKNRNKEITGHALVSHEDYEHLNQFKWYKTKDGYVKGNINKLNWFMHRYIMINILKYELTSKNYIDHIDNNKLNNTRENLRIVTPSQNSRNVKKREDSSSKFFGVSKIVSKIKNNKSYKAILRISNKKLYARYKKEEHAAYQYNLWIEQYNIKDANKNNIKIPEDFIEYKKKKDLPRGILKIGEKFIVKHTFNYNKTYGGVYTTLEEAQFESNKILKEEKIKKFEQLFTEPIKRNEQNQCIIEIFNNKKEKIANTIVDEDIYYLLKVFPIHLYNNKVKIQITDYNNSRKMMFLSRYIMNYDGDLFIDHINNNPLDNRRKNLRIATPLQNSMNKSSAKNSSSKFIGVSKYKNKWTSKIKVNDKTIHLGLFDDEIKAAKARDLATLTYFGEFGNLNFSKTSTKKNLTSKFIGVNKYKNKWRARITVNGKSIHLGLFDDEIKAAKACHLETLRYKKIYNE